MKTTPLTSTFVAMLTVAIWSGVRVAEVQAQLASSNFAGTLKDLPAGWQQLSAANFVNAYKSVTTAKGHFAEVALKVLRPHAKSLLTPIDLTGIQTTDYPMLDTLHLLCSPLLDKKKQDEIVNFLKTRQDNWVGRPYAEIRGKVAMMMRVRAQFFALQEGKKWVQGGGNIADVPAEDLPYAQLAFSQAEIAVGSFSITWQGQVTAPKSGAYTFSVSPINVNAVRRDQFVRKTMSVSIGGQVVISATPENWTYESAPVNLQAGTSVTLQVDLTIESSGYPPGALHAALSWDGPGVAKSIIPTKQLSTPAGDQQGLSATYRWKAGTKDQSMTRTDATIDFAWPVGGMAVAKNSVIEVQSNDRTWRELMSPAHLDALEAAGKRHTFLDDPQVSADRLSAAQRKAFLIELVARPALLDSIAPRRFMRLYRAFRFGATDAAFDVLGLWAMRNASFDCAMPGALGDKNPDVEMRYACLELALCVTQQLPLHATRLQSEVLELPDGTCCLPAAYILGYSYLSRGKLDEWIALLEARLQNATLTGNRRVNWLLARAQAHEIRLSPAKPYVGVMERMLDGRGWIEEAILVAETPEVKLRATKELAARLSAVRQFAAARDLIQQASADAPANLKASVNAWRGSVDALEAASAQAQVTQAAEAQEAYLNELRRRRDRAAAGGNTQAADRYNALIGTATSQP